MTDRIVRDRRRLRTRSSEAVAAVILLLSMVCITVPRAVQHADITAGTRQAGVLPAARSMRDRVRGVQLPLSFEVNRGQAAPAVRFLAHGVNTTMLLTDTGVALALSRSAVPVKRPGVTGRPWLSDLDSALAATGISRRRAVQSRARIRLRFLDANPRPAIVGLDPLPGRVNYLLGNNPRRWRTGIPTYRRVEYRDVYPGVNLVLYGRAGTLEYDWDVAPGADVRGIQLGVNGALGVALDRDGTLRVLTPAGPVLQSLPHIYQLAKSVRRAVAGHYVVRGSHVGLVLGRYDHALPLTIDPGLDFSTYLGGSGEEIGLGIAVDATGASYVTGPTASTDFPTCPSSSGATPCASSGSPMQASNGGGTEDIFIAKLNPAGTALEYSTYLGGAGDDDSFRVGIAGTGGAGRNCVSSCDAFVAGYTTSPNFLTCPSTVASSGCTTTGSPLQATLHGTRNAFVAELNPGGSQLVYSTYLGGSRTDEADDIAVDATGAAYVVGYTVSPNFPTCPSTSIVSVPGQDACAMSGRPLQPSLDGSAVSCRTFGSSAALPCIDAFVAKLNPSGTALDYSTYLGGSFDDLGYGIAVDAGGDAYVVGTTRSTDFPTCPSSTAAAPCRVQGAPVQATMRGYANAFIAKLNASGTGLVYSTYFGGENSDYGNSVAVGTDGSAYVTGDTESKDLTLCPNADGSPPCVSQGVPLQGIYSPNQYNISDAFILKLTPAGTGIDYSTYLGGSNSDAGFALAIDDTGNAFVVGPTYSSDFPTCPNAAGAPPCLSRGAPFRSQLTGGTSGCYGPVQPCPDAFVAEIDAPGTGLVTSTYLGGTAFDSGNGIAVAGHDDVYIIGTTFSADLPICPNNTSSAPCNSIGSPLQSTNHGNADAWVTKFSTAPAVVPIVAGWNLIDLPRQNQADLTASGLVGDVDTAIGSGDVAALATYAAGRFTLYVPGYSTDQSLAPSQGIFLLSRVVGTWIDWGGWYPSSPPVSLTPGWNLAAAPYLETTSTNNVAAQIAAAGASVEEIVTYVGGVYRVWTPGKNPITIPNTSGMWIETSGAASWDPQ